MSKTQRYRRQITADMDQLQATVESQGHITSPSTVETQLESLSLRLNKSTGCFYWILEEDQDYVQGCQHALEEGLEWKVNQ